MAAVPSAELNLGRSELDKCLKQINESFRTRCEAFWKIDEHGLYNEATRPGSTERYSNFVAFCTDELQTPKSIAYTLKAAHPVLEVLWETDPDTAKLFTCEAQFRPISGMKKKGPDGNKIQDVDRQVRVLQLAASEGEARFKTPRITQKLVAEMADRHFGWGKKAPEIDTRTAEEREAADKRDRFEHLKNLVEGLSELSELMDGDEAYEAFGDLLPADWEELANAEAFIVHLAKHFS